jgi:lipoprotein-anchoring transpeptidase ErfK/SrfK
MFAVCVRVICAAFLVTTTVTMLPKSQAKADGITIYGTWGNNVRRYSRKKYKPSYKIKKPKFDFKNGNQAAFLGANPSIANSVKRKAKRKKKYRKPVELASGGPRPNIAPKKPEVVEFNGDYAPGSIVIDTSRRMLYYVLAPTGALAYPVAVGKRGFTWTGVEKVSKVVDWPDWMPPEEMRERSPSLPIKMTGGLKNPLGAKAIYLGDTLYRIHGTNNKWSVGRASSSGCFRMYNSHVVHLAKLVGDKTTVHVIKRLPRGVVKDAKPKRKYKKRYRSKRRRRNSV